MLFKMLTFPRSRKRRARFAEGVSQFLYSQKLGARATIQSRKHEIVVFLHTRKRTQTSIPFLNLRQRRGSDSLLEGI